jgi:hypothetical protein
LPKRGEKVCEIGLIPNRMESIRKMLHKLGPVQHVRTYYEAGRTRF